MRLLHELAGTNLPYLSKDKKDKKYFTLQFALKFAINTCFEEEARGYASHFMETLSKNEWMIKLEFILI